MRRGPRRDFILARRSQSAGSDAAFAAARSAREELGVSGWRLWQALQVKPGFQPRVFRDIAERPSASALRRGPRHHFILARRNESAGSIRATPRDPPSVGPRAAHFYCFTPAQATGPCVIPTKPVGFAGTPSIKYSLGQVNCPARFARLRASRRSRVFPTQLTAFELRGGPVY